VGRLRQLDRLGLREHLAPLLEEDRLEDGVAHAPDEQCRRVQPGQSLVDAAHQPGAAVALGQGDLALEGKRART